MQFVTDDVECLKGGIRRGELKVKIKSLREWRERKRERKREAKRSRGVSDRIRDGLEDRAKSLGWEV